MPAALIAALMQALRILLMAKIGAIVAKLLLFFGLTIAVNRIAITPLLDQLEGYVAVLGTSGGIAATAVAWAGVLRFDDALSMLLSAYSTALTIKQARVALGIAPGA